jgi:hypothetical protein
MRLSCFFPDIEDQPYRKPGYQLVISWPSLLLWLANPLSTTEEKEGGSNGGKERGK